MFKVVLNDVTSHTAIIEEEEEDPFCLNNAFSLRHLTFLSLYNGSFLLVRGGGEMGNRLQLYYFR